MKKIKEFLQGTGVKTAAIILSILLSIGLVLTFLKGLSGFVQDPRPLAPFAAGLVFWLWIWHAYLRKSPRTMWHTWEHELTHAFFCILTFTKVHGFHADEKSYKPEGSKSTTAWAGHVSHAHAPGWRGVLITLAPYFFPTFTIILLLGRLIVSDSFQPVIEVMIGITFGYYVVNRYRDIRSAIRVAREDEAQEHDFQKHGVPFSLSFTVFANLVIMPGIMIVLHQGWVAAGGYCVSGGRFWFDLLIS